MRVYTRVECSTRIDQTLTISVNQQCYLGCLRFNIISLYTLPSVPIYITYYSCIHTLSLSLSLSLATLSLSRSRSQFTLISQPIWLASKLSTVDLDYYLRATCSTNALHIHTRTQTNKISFSQLPAKRVRKTTYSATHAIVLNLRFSFSDQLSLSSTNVISQYINYTYIHAHISFNIALYHICVQCVSGIYIYLLYIVIIHIYLYAQVLFIIMVSEHSILFPYYVK